MVTASEMTSGPAIPEVRLERLRFEEVTAALEGAPIAWIPLGSLEYHADHLPNGTDGIIGHEVPVRAARRVGGAAGGPAVLVTNPAPVSRYFTGIRVVLDGVVPAAEGLTLVDPTVGETSEPFPAATLGAEHGFYVRRLQTAELRLPVPVTRGRHSVELVLDLAGVTEASCSETVEFA